MLWTQSLESAWKYMFVTQVKTTSTRWSTRSCNPWWDPRVLCQVGQWCEWLWSMLRSWYFAITTDAVTTQRGEQKDCGVDLASWLVVVDITVEWTHSPIDLAPRTHVYHGSNPVSSVRLSVIFVTQVKTTWTRWSTRCCNPWWDEIYASYDIHPR